MKRTLIALSTILLLGLLGGVLIAQTPADYDPNVPTATQPADPGVDPYQPPADQPTPDQPTPDTYSNTPAQSQATANPDPNANPDADTNPDDPNAPDRDVNDQNALPKTGSEMPLLGAIGAAAVGALFALRALRQRRDESRLFR